MPSTCNAIYSSMCGFASLGIVTWFSVRIPYIEMNFTFKCPLLVLAGTSLHENIAASLSTQPYLSPDGTQDVSMQFVYCCGSEHASSVILYLHNRPIPYHFSLSLPICLVQIPRLPHIEWYSSPYIRGNVGSLKGPLRQPGLGEQAAQTPLPLVKVAAH